VRDREWVRPAVVTMVGVDREEAEEGLEEDGSEGMRRGIGFVPVRSVLVRC